MGCYVLPQRNLLNLGIELASHASCTGTRFLTTGASWEAPGCWRAFPSLRSFPFFPLVFPKQVSAPKAGLEGPHTHLLLPRPRQTLLTHHGLLPTEQDSAWDSSSEPGVSGPQELNRGEKDGVRRWSGAGRCPEKTRVAARQAEAHGT